MGKTLERSFNGGKFLAEEFEEEFWIKEGELRGQDYCLFVHSWFVDYAEQFFEATRCGRTVFLDDEDGGSDLLRVPSPICIPKETFRNLSRRKIDRYAKRLLKEAIKVDVNKRLCDFIEDTFPYQGFVCLWRDRGPTIIVETQEWFNQNPNWMRNLYKKTPVWKE